MNSPTNYQLSFQKQGIKRVSVKRIKYPIQVCLYMSGLNESQIHWEKCSLYSCALLRAVSEYNSTVSCDVYLSQLTA